MRLKAIDLHGFKSFATPTRLEFPGRVTVIVGPNGSGKSNIAEAIRWALGEQSLSTLRVRRGEDLIFAGSDQRPRAGMAEVTLIFDNAEGDLPVDFAEVALTRRVYRDGEGEYLLNGNRVRLRDIQDLLGATPLARRTYTVIGQGLVDEVLRMRPEERRALFEEAAGIALYRMKREEALRRLEATQQNLTRVRDLLAEITPRLNSLRRQAERARQYEETLSRLKALWRRWAARRMAALRRGLEEAQAALAAAEAARLRHQEQQAAAEAEATRLREEIRGRRAALQEEEAAWGRLQEALADLRRRRQALEEALRGVREQERVRRGHREALQNRQAALEARQRALEEAREALWRRAQALQAQRWEQEARHEPQRARGEALRRQLEALQEAERQREAEIDRLARRRLALEALLCELEEQARQETCRWQEREARHAALREERERLRGEAQALREAREALDRRVVQARRSLEEAEAEVIRAREAIARAEAEQAYLESYAEALARRREAQEGWSEDLRAILSAGLPGVLGVLADFLEVDPGWEVAVAAILGPLLQALIVREARVLEALRPQVRHGLPVILLDALRFERPRPARHRLPLPGSLPVPAGLLPAARVVRAREPRLQAWLERRLQGIWLAKTWEDARDLRSRLPRSAHILTPEGERMSGEGIVWIGRHVALESAGWIEAPQWRALRGQLEEAQRARRQAEEALERAMGRWQHARETLAALEEEGRALEAQREALQRALREVEGPLEAEAQSLQALAREAAAWEARRAELAAEQAHLARREQALMEERRALAEARASLEKELAALGLEEMEGERIRLQAEERWLEEERRQLEEQIARLVAERQALEVERTALEDPEGTPSWHALEVERMRLQEALQDLEARRQAQEARRAQEMALLLSLESAFEAAWEQVETLRRVGQEREEAAHAAQLERVRREGELRAFQQALREEWRHLEGSAAPDEPSELNLEEREGIDAEEPLEALEAEVEALRRALRRLGPVNPEAAAEYTALRERHAFLTAQVADLEAASASLRQTVEALDRQMQQAFAETFRAVGRAFRETFPSLFGGGNARLALTEAERWDQAGVEIYVRVPGKRTQSLMMLSGGEKALTATALIFALLSVRPSPFVILDEADAMLDEANIGRFREMIRRLSERTQFILITHNRGTVDVANVLYGVTMRPDGTSQVLSLRLEEAEQMMTAPAKP
ncbi:MAG: chromosome segregation protein SMC [Thermoflexus sp.]|nr:chromosome segregation protein SMC [Thermoflexus sp.]